METGKLLLEKALRLKPQERFMLIEGLIKSIDEPDRGIHQTWAEEAEKKLKACREGRLEQALAEREKMRKKLEQAASDLLDDYKNDPELTAFTALDSEDFYA